MAAPKRTPDQRRRDLAIVANLYMQGYTQAEIAEHLNGRTEEDRDYTISRHQISYDLISLREEWLNSALVDLDKRKAQELAKLDHLEREYWEAWHRSLQAEETITTEMSEDDEGRMKRTVKGSSGDPRYLQGIERCINRRIELFGLDAPKRTEAQITQTQITGVFELGNLDIRELNQLEQILAKALPGPANAAEPGSGNGGDSAGEGAEEPDLLHGDDVLEVQGRTVS